MYFFSFPFQYFENPQDDALGFAAVNSRALVVNPRNCALRDTALERAVTEPNTKSYDKILPAQNVYGSFIV